MDMKISIKGIIISVISALAGATLIAFGSYHAGRRGDCVRTQTYVEKLNKLERENETLKNDNEIKIKELGEEIQCLNKTLENQKKAYALKLGQLEEEKLKLQEDLDNCKDEYEFLERDLASQAVDFQYALEIGNLVATKARELELCIRNYEPHYKPYF